MTDGPDDSADARRSAREGTAAGVCFERRVTLAKFSSPSPLLGFKTRDPTERIPTLRFS